MHTQRITSRLRSSHLVALLAIASATGCGHDSRFARNDSNSVEPPTTVAAATPSPKAAMASAQEHGMAKDMSEGVVHAVGRPVSDDVDLFAQMENQNDVALTASTTAAKANMSMPTLRTLGATEDLQTALNNASGIVLVDFYADWCGPCRRQAKVLHEVEAKAKSMGAEIIKVDVDKHTKLAEQYEVGSLPTLIAFRNGTVVHRKLGLTDKDQILTILGK